MSRSFFILNAGGAQTERIARGSVLRLAGFRVADAARGDEALRLAHDCEPDLIILNIALPDADGYDVCRRMKAAAPATPVLHISVVPEDSTARLRSLETGGDAFLAEPLPPDLLVATARALLRAKSVNDELAGVKRQLGTHIERLTRLHRLTTRLPSDAGARALFEEILSAVAELQGTHMATLLLWDDENNELTLKAWVGFAPEVAALVQKLPAGFGCAGRAVVERRPVIVEDVETDPEYASMLGVARQAGYRAIYSIPLLGRDGEVLGAIATMFPAPHWPSEADIETAELYAREAAGAIGHARELQRRDRIGRELETLLARTREQAELIDLSHDAIITTDSNRAIIDWNAGAEELYGWTAAEAIGKPAHELLRTRAGPLSPAGIDAALAGAGRWEGEVVHTRRDGARIIIESRHVLVRDAHGQPVRYLEINRDITARRRMEEALRSNERRFRATFDHANVGIAHVGLDGRWLRVNPKVLEIVGYAEQELTRKTFEEVTHPDDLQRDLQLFRRLLDGEIESYSVEKRYVRRNGETVWAHISVSLLRDAEGRPEHAISVIQDIHERKVAGEALRESEATIRSFYDSAPMLMGVVEIAENDILHISGNSAAADFFGVDDARGRWASAMGDPARGILQWLERYRESRHSGAPVMFEFPCERNGIPRCLWVTVSFIETRPNGRARFSYVAEDITERKRAEADLRQQYRITETIAHHAAAALFVIDTGGRVSFMNPAAEQMFGWTREELVGQVVHEKLHYQRPDGTPLPRGECPIEQVFRTGSPLRGHEDVFYRKDGAPIAVGCSNAPILRDGKVTASVLVVHDISERKLSEERLRQSQKLESIGLLAGGIAHDFNNILTAIMGNASFAADLLDPGHPARRMIDSVVQYGERAADLVRQMLAYAGKGRFFVEPVDASEAVRGVADLLGASMPERTALRLDLAEDLPHIRADRVQVQQVVMNLTINAAEAVEGVAGGAVSVTTRAFEAADETRRDFWGETIPRGEYVRIEVSDNGPGITADVLPKIFDPFFTTKFVGRGLGLSAVAGIVRAHSGFLELHTAPGEGAVFTVYFPTIVDPAPAEEHLAERDHDGPLVH